MRKPLLIILTCVCGLACFGQSKIRQDAVEVSIIRLIGSPDEFEGKTVRVIGFLHLEFEGNGVYVREEDFERSLTKNGLWVSSSPEIAKEMSELSDRYVLIEGVFSSKSRGHFGMWSGSISEINRVMAWPFTRSKK